MADLRLVGLTDDGARLILEHADGEREHLAVDERLRTALIRPASAATQTQLDLESQLTPREIQARIRAGQSLEGVALEAGITVERVERFAGPILHEREHIAQEAAKVSVGRDDEGAVMLLGELVGHRLEERGVPRDGMHWDAWRRDDGGWEVRLDYLAGGKERSAEWVYDPVRRTMTADDDEARWLLEEEPSAAGDSPALGAGRRRGCRRAGGRRTCRGAGEVWHAGSHRHVAQGSRDRAGRTAFQAQEEGVRAQLGRDLVRVPQARVATRGSQRLVAWESALAKATA